MLGSVSAGQQEKTSPKPPAAINVNTEEIWSASFIAEFTKFQIVTEEFNIVLQIYVKPQGCHFGMKAATSKASGPR